MNIRTLINSYDIFKNPRLSVGQLRQIQNQKLSRMVKHAYENVVYYRRLFKSAGIVPKDVRCVDDLPKIPITYKTNLQNQESSEFISKNNSREIISMATSGSTGFPLEAKLTKDEYDYWKLLLLRAFFEGKARLTDKFAVLAHPFRFPKQARWFQNWGILRHKYISALKPPEVFAAEILKAKPDVILGYGGALRLFLLELEKMPKLKNPPRLIFSSAERLDNETRRLAQQLLGCSITDLYSTVETGPIAWQCQRKKGYHINIDSVVIECIDKNGKTQVGKSGNLVCTNLFNFTMPFIRYCLDDIGTLTNVDCDCGSGFPLLDSLEGKASDFLVLKDRVLSPVATETILKKYVIKARYRIIQHAIDILDLELLPGLGFDVGLIPGIVKGIKEDLSQEAIQINVKIVNFEHFNQEKFRTVISHVPKSFS